MTGPGARGTVTPVTAARLGDDFHGKHRMTYGHASPGESVQLVNLRVAAVGKLDGLDLGRMAAAPPAGAATTARPREAYFKETGLVRCDVLARDALGPGTEGRGPVIVEATDTTVLVPPGWRWRADSRGFLILEGAHA